MVDMPNTAADPVGEALTCAAALAQEGGPLGFGERLAFRRAWRRATGFGPGPWLQAAASGAISAADLERLGGVVDYLEARARLLSHEPAELAARLQALHEHRGRLQRAALAIRLRSLQGGRAPWTSGRKA